MTVHYKIADGAVIVTARPPYHFKQGVDIVRDIVMDPAYRSGMRLLYDIRHTSDTTTFEKLRTYSAFQDSIGIPFQEVGILVDSDLLFDVSKEFAVLAKARDMTVEVFRDPASATRWVTRGAVS